MFSKKKFYSFIIVSFYSYILLLQFYVQKSYTWCERCGGEVIRYRLKNCITDIIEELYFVFFPAEAPSLYGCGLTFFQWANKTYYNEIFGLKLCLKHQLSIPLQLENYLLPNCFQFLVPSSVKNFYFTNCYLYDRRSTLTELRYGIFPPEFPPSVHRMSRTEVDDFLKKYCTHYPAVADVLLKLLDHNNYKIIYTDPHYAYAFDIRQHLTYKEITELYQLMRAFEYLEKNFENKEVELPDGIEKRFICPVFYEWLPNTDRKYFKLLASPTRTSNDSSLGGRECLGFSREKARFWLYQDDMKFSELPEFFSQEIIWSYKDNCISDFISLTSPDFITSSAALMSLGMCFSAEECFLLFTVADTSSLFRVINLDSTGKLFSLEEFNRKLELKDNYVSKMSHCKYAYIEIPGILYRFPRLMVLDETCKTILCHDEDVYRYLQKSKDWTVYLYPEYKRQLFQLPDDWTIKFIDEKSLTDLYYIPECKADLPTLRK